MEIRRLQQIRKPLSPLFFSFVSKIAALCHILRDICVTAGRCRRTWPGYKDHFRSPTMRELSLLGDWNRDPSVSHARQLPQERSGSRPNPEGPRPFSVLAVCQAAPSTSRNFRTNRAPLLFNRGAGTESFVSRALAIVLQNGWKEVAKPVRIIRFACGC